MTSSPRSLRRVIRGIAPLAITAMFSVPLAPLVACSSAESPNAGCTTDTDCKGDRVCSKGECVDAGTTTSSGGGAGAGTTASGTTTTATGAGGGATTTASTGTGMMCDAGNTLCGSACIDTTNDANHCGGCGMACAAGKFCQVGACISVTEGMVSIPAGTFTMGDADNTEKAGMVTVSAFFMDVTEVTTEAYAACVSNNKCTAAKTDNSCNTGVAGRENHPINCVDWNQATAYCAAQGRRLPTEEEWEYAARGTDGRLFPWGNTAPTNQLCWNGAGNDLGAGNRKSTCAVAFFSAGNSPFDLSDMSGNVWEWTSSAYGSDHRIYRGASWYGTNPSDVRSARRYGDNPSGQDYTLGFRCAGSFFP